MIFPIIAVYYLPLKRVGGLVRNNPTTNFMLFMIDDDVQLLQLVHNSLKTQCLFPASVSSVFNVQYQQFC